MKKKFLASILVMGMILSMTACNTASTVNDTPSGESAQASGELSSEFQSYCLFGDNKSKKLELGVKNRAFQIRKAL